MTDFFEAIKIDGFVKSPLSDGFEKSSRCKVPKSLGMKRTYRYAAMTEDDEQRRRWNFYEAVKIEFLKSPYPTSFYRR